MSATPLFELKGVDFDYRPDRPVLRGVDLEIHAGEFVSLIGPNGVGKSTLLSLLAGVRQPTRGSLRINDKESRAYRRKELARHIAVLPQVESVSFSFTVEQMVMMGRTPHLAGPLGLETSTDRGHVSSALDVVGIGHLRHEIVAQLSGGERQMVLLARAIAQHTEVLLLDEPTSALDLAHRQEVMRVVKRRNEECGLTVVMAAHDLNLAARYSERMILMSGQGIAADGPPTEVMREDLLREVFGAEIWLSQGPDGSPMVGLEK